jgi:hypothetical protein
VYIESTVERDADESLQYAAKLILSSNKVTGEVRALRFLCETNARKRSDSVQVEREVV